MLVEPQRTLYVRKVPDALLRRAKALAARRGETLTQLVLRALEEEVSGAEPEAAGGPAHAGLEADMAWYEAHLDELLPRYQGEYVAVVDGEVVDHDRDFDPLARRVFERYCARSVYLPKCLPGERRVRLRSPRRVTGS